MKQIAWLWMMMLAPAVAIAAPPTLEALLKPPQYTLASISPGGEYVAMGTRIDDKVMVAIVDSKTKKVLRGLDPEDKGAVDRLYWVGKERIFVMTSRVGEGVEQAYLEPAIVAINVDGSKRKAFYSGVFDSIRNDDDHVLIRRCGKNHVKGCWTYVQKVDTNGGFSGPRVADAPVVNASFMADDDGNVRFAFATDDQDIQQLWYFTADKWSLINDEAQSGVEVTPLGTSRDGAYGYLQSERRTGPDVIQRVEFATGKREDLLSDTRLDPSFIVWSADGAQPIGAAYGLEMPRARFWDPKDPDAKLLRQLEIAFPKEAVSFGGGSRDGKSIIVNVWSDRNPRSVYLLDRTSRQTTLVFNARPGLDPDSLAPAQLVEFKARGGIPLSGYLTLPLATGSRPPPLVVLPHGGPFAIRDDWGYDEEVQILAAHGYAVLRVNFRGSGGFGRSFIESGFKQWGKTMQDDLTDATQWAVGSGKIDGSRICIWGSSYGGYAALMGVAQSPDLYKCAIATAAVSDLSIMRKWGDTHQTREGRAFLDRSVGSDPKELTKYSPVTYASSIKADVLLIHGLRDQRVSFEHAKAMRSALEKAGKHYEGYFPRNETHGIYGEENREEYYQKVLAFLDKRIGPLVPGK